MKKSLIKKLLLAGVIVGVAVGSYVLYLLNMPHRDIQGEKAFTEINAKGLVDEFLFNLDTANEKYLDQVIIVEGTVSETYEDQKGQVVVVFAVEERVVGVSCTFMEETNENARNLKKGEVVRVKGVLQSGAEIDEDLGLNEDVILEKCDVV
ncbi:MAG: hypothetical protein IIA45_10565 [Bacteroidetes bacterium]|nr:hypothetical protein [Bacteroidota bacterium]